MLKELEYTKLSEAIKLFEEVMRRDRARVQCGLIPKDPHAGEKIVALETMISAIGDVEMLDDYIEVFTADLIKPRFKPIYEQIIDKIRIMYKISCVTRIPTKDLTTLFTYYQRGIYTLMFDEIKESLLSEGDLREKLETIKEKAIKYGEIEAGKLEYLKEDYSKDFIDKVQDVIKKECLPALKAIDMLPGVEFIKSSKVQTPLGYYIKSAEDLVIRRLRSRTFEEDYQKTSLDSKITLGWSSTGDLVFTSFTKKQYEVEIEEEEKIRLLLMI